MVISRSEYIVEDRLESTGLVRGGDPRITAFNEFAEVIANPTERLVGFQSLTNEANVTADSQTWVIIHGYNSDSNGPNIDVLEQSVVQHARPNDRILSLDWREAAANQISPIGNFVAATWSAPVAEYVAQTLQNQYGISPQSASNTVNLVGHSLGAYMAGEIGKAFRDGVTDEAGNTLVAGNGVGVRTITALDPASRANNLLAQDNFISFEQKTYDMNGRILGDQAPQSFADVSRFSRAFNGTNSAFGNEAAAATADEVVAMSFDSSGPFSRFEEHARVLLAFANIDEQPGRIGSNLGIRAYASTSGSLPLSTWQEIPNFQIADSNRSFTAVLDVDIANQSNQLLGLRNSGIFNNIVIGDEGRNSLGGFEPPVNGNPGVIGDRRYSGQGADILYGEGGSDTLSGGSGADILIGGTGADSLTGGTGRDTFVLSSGDGSINPMGTNTINDFVVGEDVFGLWPGLTYEDLTFSSVTASIGGNIVSGSTVITEATTGLDLARLEGALLDDISPASNFIEVQPGLFEVV